MGARRLCTFVLVCLVTAQGPARRAYACHSSRRQVLCAPSPLRRALVTLYCTVREEATPQQRHLETLTVGCHILQYCEAPQDIKTSSLPRVP